MKQFLLTVTILFFFLNVQSQITEGNWLVGGSGSFSLQSQNAGTTVPKASNTNISISPNIGYFVSNRFAVGIMPSYSRSVYSIPISATTQSIYFGPFLKYYFLNAERNNNLFTQLAYQYGKLISDNGSDQNTNNLTASIGYVVFFNSSVALEFKLNYNWYKLSISEVESNTYSFGIGFQIHLEKMIG